MLVFPAANDLLTMFVALEVLSLPLYLLCGFARRRRLLSQEAAVKYFLLGAFSSAFFLMGAAMLYGYSGSVALPDIAAAVRTNISQDSLLLLGFGLLIIGLLFKVGAAPFHSWTPDVYQGAPTSITAFMAAATKVAAFGAMLRVLYVAFPDNPWAWQPVLWAVAIITMVLGTVVAVVQDDIKRVLAYSSVAHAGFILTGVLALNAERPERLDVLPGGVRRHDDRGVRRPHAGARRRAGRPRASPRGPASGRRSPLFARDVLAVPARPGRHPAHERVRGQGGGLRGGHLRRGGRPRRRRASWPAPSRWCSTSASSSPCTSRTPARTPPWWPPRAPLLTGVLALAAVATVVLGVLPSPLLDLAGTSGLFAL